MATRDEDILKPLPGDAPEDYDFPDGVRVRHMAGDEVEVVLDPDALDEPDEAPSAEHQENLANKLDREELGKIATKVIEYVETDRDSRKGWENRAKDALYLLGLEDIPGDELPFDGASGLAHPVIAEAVYQFQSRASAELLPPGGPVKSTIVGETDEENEEQAERVEEFMNYLLTEEDDGFYDDAEQMMTYMPLFGSAMKKVFVEPMTGLSLSRFVPVNGKTEDFIVPYDATDLRTAARYTHEFKMTRNDLRRAMSEGAYREVELVRVGAPVSEDGKGESIVDTADGRTESRHDDDQEYTILEMHADWEISVDNHDDYAPPYIITVIEETSDVLAIRRNWQENDEKRRKRVWFAHYRFLPGLGFYGFGLMHVIGSLGLAASGALRALLDSAARSNLQGGYKAADARVKGGDQYIKNGEWIDVDVPAEELSKAFYTPPFKEPSQALFNLMEYLVDRARSFASSTDVMTGEADNKGPVGTTLALIEQGAKMQSAIHKRMHHAARYEYKMLALCLFENMEQESYPYDVQGERREVFKKDFDGRVDIIPVSDPNIFSHTQRIALAQATFEMVTSDERGVFTQKHVVEAYRRMMEALRVPEPDKLLPPEDKAERFDPVTENMEMLAGNSVKAFAEQAHEAHIMVHERFLADLAATVGEQAASELEPVMKAHLAEHYAWAYRQEVEMMMGGAMPPHDLSDPEKKHELPVEVENNIALKVAQALSQTPPKQAPEDDGMSEEEREQAAWEAEQQRKQKAWEAEQQRKAQEAAMEQQREEAEWQAEQAREAEGAEVERDEKDLTALQNIMARASKLLGREKPKEKDDGDSG